MASVFPEWARGSHGDLSQQNRSVGPVRGDALGSAPPADALATLAKRNGCLSCHGIDKRLVGPAFRDVAARYKTDADAETKLVTRVRKGGAGTWGPLVMPPYPDLPDADALALVRWVLAQ
jgi:cytochrome c